MKSVKLLGLALCAALPLLAAARPAAAAEVNVVARAVGAADPGVVSWVDTADGKLGLDDKFAAAIHAMFANVQYLYTDQGLLLGRLQGQELKTIMPPAAFLANDQNTAFLAHVRNKDRTLFLDGTAVQFQSDPTKGYAQWTLLLVNKDGSTITSHIEQALTFPSAAAGQTTNPNPFSLQ